MFLEAQRFLVNENILYQDNQSAIKIEENGKKSGDQNTKHMNIWYFFIKDRLKSEGIKVVYWPTGKMIADFLQNHCKGDYSLSSGMLYYDTYIYLTLKTNHQNVNWIQIRSVLDVVY